MSAGALNSLVYARGASRPFGELTQEDVLIRADELRSAVGFGPTARIAPVAQAWRELAVRMQAAGAATVAELPAEFVTEMAPRLWVLPPGGSLIP